jgi:hypothetical protein
VYLTSVDTDAKLGRCLLSVIELVTVCTFIIYKTLNLELEKIKFQNLKIVQILGLKKGKIVYKMFARSMVPFFTSQKKVFTIISSLITNTG